MTRRGLVACALGLVVACGANSRAPAAPVPPVPVRNVGDVLTDAAGWVEYTVGDAPLIITAPHGGALAPASLPDRTCAGCVTVTDDNTEDLPGASPRSSTRARASGCTW